MDRIPERSLDKDHKATEEESVKVIHRAKELGVTHLDTAITYGFGHNESLVGGRFDLSAVPLLGSGGGVQDASCRPPL